MKKTIALALIAATTMFFATAASAAEGFYLGAGVGQGKHSGMPNFGVPVTKSSDTTYDILAGYSLNENVAFEAAYTNLGRMVAGTANTKFSAVSLDVVGKLPIPAVSGLSVFGKAGVARTTIDITSNRNAGGNVGKTSTNGVTYGFGAGYDFTPDFGVTLSYDNYRVGDILHKWNESNVALNGVFHF